MQIKQFIRQTGVHTQRSRVKELVNAKRGKFLGSTELHRVIGPTSPGIHMEQAQLKLQGTKEQQEHRILHKTETHSSEFTTI